MAKLGVFYGLCPLIDQKSFLGVSKDEEQGYVIVTLGKNMAIKYKLSDQKQVYSWSTKDHLSSQIIYDKTLNQYVAVFNNIAIRTFGSDCENLDRIKKFKFQRPIHSLASTKCGRTLVIFKDGTISEISKSLDQRKTASDRESILEPNEVIESHNCVTHEDRIVVSYLVKNTKGLFKFIAVFLNNDLEEDRDNIIQVVLERGGVNLTGHLLVVTDEAFELITIWSDGKLYSLPLHNALEFPGNLLSVIELLSCDQKICMLYLNPTYIVLYGADKAQEGASLIVYNTQFQVIQCKQPFKIYNSASQIFHVEENILLTVGNHLAVLPYQLATEQLSALVGSHRTSTSLNDPDIMVVTELDVGNWDEECPKENLKRKMPEVVNITESLPEVVICEEIIPSLIEERNIDGLMEVIKYFKEIPEKYLVELLVFVLEVSDLSESNCDLLNLVLNLPFNDVLLIPHLRNMEFNLTLQLLRYLCVVWGDDSNTETIREDAIINWGCNLLDAHYQKFLLSQDDAVIEILKLFQSLVNMQFACLDECKILLAHLEMLKRGKSSKHIQKHSKWYSIEQVSLY